MRPIDSFSARLRILVIASAVVGSLAIPAAVLAADAPNSCAGVSSTSPQNTWLADSLPTATDQDWYRFTTPTGRWALITLGQLPANYRLDLYSACGTLKGSSNRSGTTYEELYLYLPAGTYRVSVRSAAGGFSASAYVLRFRSLGEAVQGLSSTAYTDSIGYLHIVGEVLNNTTTRRIYVEISATFYNSSNQVIGTDFTFADVSSLASRTRSPFHLVAQKPASFHHYSYLVSSSTTTTAPVGNLILTAGIPYTDGVGYRHYPGQVKNANTYGVRYVEILLTLYTNRGLVMNTDFTFTNPSSISAGGTAPFEVLVGDHYAGANRYTLKVQAVR
jgi:hypothetical protein